jgi:hypothetical protein
MLWTLIVILVVIWLVATILSWTLGGLIHLLLVIAAIVLIYNLLAGRRTT